MFQPRFAPVTTASVWRRRKIDAVDTWQLLLIISTGATRNNTGQYAYATNRLVDLLTGPLNDPGRAMGELRRLIDRAPQSPAAVNAPNKISLRAVQPATRDMNQNAAKL